MQKVYVKSHNLSDTCLWIHRTVLDFKAGGDIVSEGLGDGAMLYELNSGEMIDFLPDGTAELEEQVIGTWETPSWPRNSCVIIPIIPK